jgi:SLT domain-containing protein
VVSTAPLARAFVRVSLDLKDTESTVRSAVQKAGQSGAAEAERQGKTISERFKHGMEFAAGFTGVELGLKGLHEVVATGVNELKDYQAGYSQLQSGLKSTGGVAGITADQMEKLAGTIQGYSGQTDDSIVKTESLLLTFTNIRDVAGKNNDVFTQTTKIAADMAARMGGDASGAAIQLGKALNDPVKGLTALTRVGVSFTQEQKDQIAAMVKAGDTMGAQKIILGELNKEFGGSAEAYGKTLPGEIDKAKRAFEDFTQNAATKTLPVIVDLGKGAVTLAQQTGNVVDFFQHNEAAASGLAAVLGVAALPKLIELANVSQRFVEVKLEDALASSAGGIRAMGAALVANPELYALAAGLAAAGVAVELFGNKERDAAIDVASLTDAVKQQDTVGGSSLYDQIIKQFSDTDIANKGENVLEYLQRYKVNVAEVIQDLSSGNLYGKGGLFKLTVPIFSDPTVSGATQDKLSRFFIGLSNDVGSVRKAEAAGEKQHAEFVASLNKTPEGRFTLFMQGISDAQKKLAQSTTANNTALSNQIDVLKGYSAQADVTATGIRQHILDSIKVITEEGTNVAELAANGVSSRFIDKLKSEGPEYVAAVAGQAPEVQRQLSSLFQDSRVAQLDASKRMAAAEAPALANTVKQGQAFVQAAANQTFRDTVGKAVAAARQIAEDGGASTASGFGIHGEQGKNQVLQHMIAALPAPVRTATLQALGIATDAGGKIPQNLASAIENHKPIVVSAAEALRVAVQAKIDALHGKTIDVVTQDNASAALATITSKIQTLESYNNELKAARIGAADGVLVRGPGGPRDDVIPAWLSNGEAVIPAHLVPEIAPWAASKGIPGFAAGGFVTDEIATHPFVQSFADSLTSGPLATAFAGAGGISGNVQSWLPVVLQALALNGASAAWAPRVLAQIQFESGGDPNIHQNVIDINTFNGSGGAQGLMQVLYSTFLSNHIPGTSMNIFDPLANVAAGIHHAIYEDPGGLSYLGQGHGYDHGGILPPGGIGINTSGQPEMVRSKTQEDALVNATLTTNRLIGQLVAAVQQSAPATGRAMGAVLQGQARAGRLDGRTRTVSSSKR